MLSALEREDVQLAAFTRATDNLPRTLWVIESSKTLLIALWACQRLISLEDLGDPEESRFEVPTSLVQTHFVLPYCSTVHSSQASDVAEDFFIADWDFKRVDRKWLYTAITRLRALQNLHILDAALMRVPTDHTDLHAATLMLKGYKDQDRALIQKGRIAWTLPTDYPSASEIVEQFKVNPNCCGCGVAMSLCKSGPDKATLQRQSNTVGHTKANTRTMLCRACNARMG